MTIKKIFSFAIVGLIASNLSAERDINYVKTLPFNFTSGTPTNIRITAATSDADGKVYFVSNFTDNIHVFDPLTYNGNRDDLIILQAAGTHNNSFNSSSYNSITVDKVTGDIYAAGPVRNQTITANNSIITRLGKSGGTYTLTNLNRSDSNALSGVTSIGENKLVFSGALTGNLHFFEFDPNTNSLNEKGTITGDSSLWSPSLAVDTVNNVIYQSRSKHTITAKAAEVDKFTFEFATGTGNFSGSRVGQYIAGTNSTETAANAQPLQYQSIAINDDASLLVVPVNIAKTDVTDTTPNNFNVYDITGSAPVLIKTLNGGLDAGGDSPAAHRANTRAYGVTFFKSDGKEYLLTFYSNQASGTTVTPYPAGMSRGYVYEIAPKSDIETWELY